MSKLLDIFSKIKKEEKPDNFHLNSRVLIIDGMNTFLRGFAVVNKMNVVGHEVNGIVGFLKSLASTIKFLNPTRVIVVFDGEGGSANRKYLFPDYKGNRTNNRVMNSILFENKEDEDASKYNQLVRLIDYLNYLPITSLSMDNLEADDIIAYLANYLNETVSDSEVYIMSTDNDYVQLVNDRIKVYSPTKKVIYQTESVLSTFGVHPNNFLIYKTLIGDSSDNIPGVHGIGEATAIKLFDFITSAEPRDLEYLFEYCENTDKKSVLFERVLNSRKDVEIFYKIMDLKNVNIIDDKKEHIIHTLHNSSIEFKKYEFLKLYSYDKMGGAIPNVENWLNCFTPLINYKSYDSKQT
jgi:5'-3' exonuclease